MAGRKAGQKDQMNRKGVAQAKTVAKPTAPPAVRVSRGPVDAPGKHHRKPPPQERLDKLMGEPIGKQMGQKSVKTRGRGGFWHASGVQLRSSLVLSLSIVPPFGLREVQLFEERASRQELFLDSSLEFLCLLVEPVHAHL
jgi:hypothetical protein